MEFIKIAYQTDRFLKVKVFNYINNSFSTLTMLECKRGYFYSHTQPLIVFLSSGILPPAAHIFFIIIS